MKIHPDFADFIAALNRRHVEFVIVGAFNLAFLGSPRYTGDMDFWIRPTAKNARALLRAIADFGLKAPALIEQDVLSGKIIQLGPPSSRTSGRRDGGKTGRIWRLSASCTSRRKELDYPGLSSHRRGLVVPMPTLPGISRRTSLRRQPPRESLFSSTRKYRKA